MRKFISVLLISFCSLAWATPTHKSLSPTEQAQKIIDRTKAKITATQNYWWNLPFRTGTVRRYCDCGTGAAVGCVQGNDSTGDGSDANPYRTIGAAATWLNSSASSGATAALCRGGSFLISSTQHLGTTSCSAGTMCRDLRDYSSTQFSSTARPILYVTTDIAGINDFSTGGGYRVFNLELIGDYGGADVSGIRISNNTWPIGIYNNYIHDWHDGVQNNEYFGPTPNVYVEGNHLYHNYDWGFVGASDYGTLKYNYVDDNGGPDATLHNFYISQQGHLSHNFKVIGNYLTGQYSGGTCLGTQLVGHSQGLGHEYRNNVIDIPDSEDSGGCYGMALSNVTLNGNPVDYTNTIVDGNLIINGGGRLFSISSCPNCVITNNLIIKTSTLAGVTGMDIPYSTSRGVQDPINTANHVENNTIYFGPSSSGNNVGIYLHDEGTNHIITNNIIDYASSSGTIRCFNLPLAISAYDFIDNNECSGSSLTWEYSRGYSLSAWTSYSGFDSHSTTTAPSFGGTSNNPSIGTDFVPTGTPPTASGNGTYMPTYDFDGKTRPNPPAIGAREP